MTPAHTAGTVTCYHPGDLITPVLTHGTVAKFTTTCGLHIGTRGDWFRGMGTEPVTCAECIRARIRARAAAAKLEGAA